MNAPTLYVIAADLTKMQVLANIDEADVGRMRPGQRVTFRVDAYPTDTFIGEVAQVRLQPTTVQNVVTYSTVISVPNPDLKLKPGMTANVDHRDRPQEQRAAHSECGDPLPADHRDVPGAEPGGPAGARARPRRTRPWRRPARRRSAARVGGGEGGAQGQPPAAAAGATPQAGRTGLQRPPRRPQRPAEAAGHRRSRPGTRAARRLWRRQRRAPGAGRQRRPGSGRWRRRAAAPVRALAAVAAAVAVSTRT